MIVKYNSKNLVNGTNKIAELVVVGPFETSSLKYITILGINLNHICFTYYTSLCNYVIIEYYLFTIFTIFAIFTIIVWYITSHWKIY